MLDTEHRLFYSDSRKMESLDDESISLVVTSPPYPMIEMWDTTFSGLNKDIGAALDKGDYYTSFELMHRELGKVWDELYRVLKPGGISCINIGDATRTFAGRFQLFSNHSRMLQDFWNKGFDVLPLILWRKQTNAPNKFMGSGMLPAGAYVTLEHEYILIFRKGPKRSFKKKEERINRQESAIFWEERNNWYSDLWDFKGTRQNINKLEGRSSIRHRSGAFPFLLPYRLINMYSVYGDTVLDPFLGTGTTTLAAITCGRNSVGYEIDTNFTAYLQEKVDEPGLLNELNSYHDTRVYNHMKFVEEYTLEKGKHPKYTNWYFNFPVITNQETNLRIYPVKQIEKKEEGYYIATYGTGKELIETLSQTREDKAEGGDENLNYYQLNIQV